MPTAQEAVAAHTLAQAHRAVIDATSKLCEPLDAKIAMLADFRAQRAEQTKKLRALVDQCEQTVRKLDKVSAKADTVLSLQTNVEELSRRIRVIEEAERLRLSYEHTN